MTRPPFLFIAHSYRNDFVPWMHAATFEAVLKPSAFCHSHEGHIFDIGRSRQLQAELMLKMPEATHILYVDDDLVFPQKEALLGMYQWLEDHKEFIISGLYYEKRRDHRPLIMACEQRDDGITFAFPYRYAPPPKNSVIRVGAVPAGFLLVKREVFEKIPSPWFVLNAPQFEKNDARTSSHVMGEDIYFSLKARKHGFNLYVDTRASLVHLGTHYIGDPDMVALVDKQSKTMSEQTEEVHKQYLEKERDELIEDNEQLDKIEARQDALEKRS